MEIMQSSNVKQNKHISMDMFNQWPLYGLLFSITFQFIIIILADTIGYGHTNLNTPVLVRSPKLSKVGLGQYLDG